MRLGGKAGVVRPGRGRTVAPGQQPLARGGDAGRELGVGAGRAHRGREAGPHRRSGSGASALTSASSSSSALRRSDRASGGTRRARRGGRRPRSDGARRDGEDQQRATPSPAPRAPAATPARGVSPLEQRGRKRGRAAVSPRAVTGTEVAGRLTLRVAIRREVEIRVTHRRQRQRTRRVGHREVAEGLHPADPALVVVTRSSTRSR